MEREPRKMPRLHGQLSRADSSQEPWRLCLGYMYWRWLGDMLHAPMAWWSASPNYCSRGRWSESEIAGRSGYWSGPTQRFGLPWDTGALGKQPSQRGSPTWRWL